MPHLPTDPAALDHLRTPTRRHPWRILISGCMVGTRCGWDGTDNGMSGHQVLQRLLARPEVTAVPMCPEHLALGTPRGIPDIHGGDGLDVLRGDAVVRLDGERDITDALLTHARAMAELGETCDLAILVDMSGTCGSQVISLGDRRAADRRYQQGPALVAALLWERRIPFLSHRDHRTLDALLGILEQREPTPGLLDHHQQPWVLENLPGGPWSLTERALVMRPSPSARKPVFKILDQAAWDARGNDLPWAPIDHQDGFVHLSSADEVEATLALHFAGRSNLVLIGLDAARIPNLVWEPSRGGQLFPHVYGPVPLEAVTSVTPR